MKPPYQREAIPSRAFAKIIDDAVSAGACRVAARMSPNQAPTWNAVAEAKSRQANDALAKWCRR